MANNGIISGSETERVGATLKESVREVVDAGQERIHDVKEKIMDAKDRVVDRAETMNERVVDYIKANPLKAVGLAFGIGYIGMRLFRR